MLLPEGHPALQYCDAMLEAPERMAPINEDMMALGRRGLLDQQPADLNQGISCYPRSGPATTVTR